MSESSRMLKERSIRTRTGTWTVTGDRLVLKRAGAPGSARRAIADFLDFCDSSTSLGVIVHGALAASFVAVGAQIIRQTESRAGAAAFLVCLLFALIPIRRAVRSRGLCAAREIPLAAIERIEVHERRRPWPGGTYLVHFTDEGRLRKRPLVSAIFSGEHAYERAAEVLRAHGLLTD